MSKYYVMAACAVMACIQGLYFHSNAGAQAWCAALTVILCLEEGE